MTNTLDINNYKDLKKLTVDKTKPLDTRLKQYISDIKNPYKVRVGDILVKLEFTDGKSFINALADGFNMQSDIF